MNLSYTDIEGIILIEPGVYLDERGYFFESYNEKVFHEAGILEHFIQDNQSQSSYGIVRGLHMQNGEYAQSKLVRVLIGRIYDVAVDLRLGSKTFGQWYGAELSAENKLQLLIPKGFCHGFSVLSDSATVFYKCDKFYNQASETGLRYNDPDIGIDWKIPAKDISVSEKDAQQPFFKDVYQ